MRTMACDLPVDFDREKTARNVRRFFNRRLDWYLSQCGSNRTDLKSPTLSLAGGGSPIGNAAENKIINGMIAGVVCQCIATAIQNCSHRAKQPSYSILVGCYLDELKDWQVATQCGFAKTRFQEVKKEALCEFAERFLYWQTRAGLGTDAVNLISKSDPRATHKRPNQPLYW